LRFQIRDTKKQLKILLLNSQILENLKNRSFIAYSLFSFINVITQIIITTPATIEPPIIKAFPSGSPADCLDVKPKNNKYADKTIAISESAFIIFTFQNLKAETRTK